MSTKAKMPFRRVKLHPLDEALYVMIIILSFFLGAVLCVLMEKLELSIALTDSGVIYYSYESLALIPLLFYIIFTPFMFAALRLGWRKPLFMKLQRKGRRPYTADELDHIKKKSKILRWTAGVLGAVCLVIAPFGIYGRETMDADGLVKVYSWKNEIKESYAFSPEDASLVTFGAIPPGGKHTNAGFFISVMYNDGDEYTFSSGGFLSNSKALDFMLNFKNCLADDVIMKYEKTECLDRLINYFDMSSIEANKLRELFNEN